MAVNGEQAEGVGIVTRPSGWQRLREILDPLLASKVALIALAIVLLWVFVAVFATIISPYDPLELDYTAPNEGPSAKHPLGTDDLGRDLLFQTQEMVILHHPDNPEFLIRPTRIKIYHPLIQWILKIVISYCSFIYQAS